MKFFLLTSLTIFSFNINAELIFINESEYKYLGNLDGDYVYLFHIVEDHKYFGKESKIYKLLVRHQNNFDGYGSSTFHLQVFCDDKSYVIEQQFQQCIDDDGENCPIKEVYNFPRRMESEKSSVLDKANILICNM